jgi:hypothetical protein
MIPSPRQDRAKDWAEEQERRPTVGEFLLIRGHVVRVDVRRVLGLDLERMLTPPIITVVLSQ